MHNIPILQPRQEWVCPNCNAQSVTHEAEPHTRMHTCPGLRGLTAPMVPAGQRCEVRAVEREDYVGKESVTLDGDGRAVMAVETVRDDGNDIAVFAPCATTQSRSG